MTITVKFIDSGREPQCESNHAFPNGMDLDLSNGARECCVVTLPYPAKRCGVFSIHCDKCKTTTVVTAAGRRDDPRSLKLPCQQSLT